MNPRTWHWPEYSMEAAGLGLFMISACGFTSLLQHPSSPLSGPLTAYPWLARAFMGAAMGLTAIGLIYSPWGRRSGGHFNPSVTLTFLRLGKVAPRGAAFYVLSQFAGATAGVLLLSVLARPIAGDPAVNYAVTLPGPSSPFSRKP